MVNDFNANHLEKVIFFDDFDNFANFWGAFYIRMDVVKRKEFCANNGITFIMPETLNEIIPHTLRKIIYSEQHYGRFGRFGSNFGGGGPGGDCGGGGGGGEGDCGGGGE